MEDPDGRLVERLNERRQSLRSLRADVLRLARSEGVEQPVGVVAATRASDREQTDVFADTELLPPSVEKVFLDRVVAHLQERPLEDETWMIVDLANPVGPAIPRRGDALEVCAPVLSNREDVAAMLRKASSRIVRFMEEAGDRNRAPRRKLMLDVIVDADGVVRSVTMARASGNPYMNAQAMKVGREMEFEPGTMNDVPAAMWIQQPVTINIPAHREP
jgi:TonB family protein